MSDADLFIAAAEEARERGYGIRWLRPGEKHLTDKGWTLASQEPGDYRPGCNLGLMTGRISADLVCVDLDSAEAIRLGSRFLPPTSMIDGRESKPLSHRWYTVTNVPPHLTSDCESARHFGGGPRIRRYPAPARIDLQGVGAQCVIPPSMGSGERREWFEGCMGWPAVVDCRELYAAVAKLATVCGWKPPPVIEPSRPRAFTGRGNVERRAVAYLTEMPPAVSGAGGHNATMAAARAVVWGFDLGPVTGLELLSSHYNPRCRPPWSEKDLRHKAHDADTKPFDKPRGWLLGEEALAIGGRR